MQHTQERVIDNVKYTTTQFPATKGIKMMHRLGKFISNPIAKLAGMVKPGSKALDSEVSAEVLGQAVQAFFESCDEATLELTVKELLTSTTRDGRPIVFDSDFCGQMGHLFKVLAFILEVNFKDFFSGIAALRKS